MISPTNLLKFKLRSLIIATIALGCGLGWYADKAIQQRNAVEWVKANDGEVYYDHEFDRERSFTNPGAIYVNYAPPPGPDWIRNWLGIDFLDSVVAIELYGHLTTRDIKRLAQFDNLEFLHLYSNTHCDYRPLSCLRSLTALQIYDTPVSNIGFVRDMNKLKRFVLNNTNVVDLEPIRGLSNLRQLAIVRSPVFDLTPIQVLEELNRLEVTEVEVEDWSPLVHVSKLRYLAAGKIDSEQQSIIQNALPDCECFFY